MDGGGIQEAKAPAEAAREAAASAQLPARRGSHSSTSRLNVSTFCGIRWVCGSINNNKRLNLS